MVHGYAPMGIEDWPVVAVAILLGISIWTEDQDFLGAALPPGRPIVSNCIYRIGKTATRTFPVRFAGALLGQNSTLLHRLPCE